MYEFTYLLKFVNSESILAVLSCRMTRNVDMSTSLFLRVYFILTLFFLIFRLPPFLVTAMREIPFLSLPKSASKNSQANCFQ